MNQVLPLKGKDQDLLIFKNPKNLAYRFVRFWIGFRLRDFARGNQRIVPGDERIRRVAEDAVRDCYAFCAARGVEIEQYNRENGMGHGWVTPNANGAVARCGGPALCEVCKAEQKFMERTAFEKRNDLMRPTDLPIGGSIWRHYKGGEYRVLLMANDQTTFPEKFPVSVVYQSVSTGYIWTRPFSQWKESMTFVREADPAIPSAKAPFLTVDGHRIEPIDGSKMIRGHAIDRVFVDELSDRAQVDAKESQQNKPVAEVKNSSFSKDDEEWRNSDLLKDDGK